MNYMTLRAPWMGIIIKCMPLPLSRVDHTIWNNLLNFPLVECNRFRTFIMIRVSDYVVFYLSTSRKLVVIKHHALALRWPPKFRDLTSLLHQGMVGP